MFQLPQNYVGLVNVVGDCHCFGVAVFHHQPIYLNLTGAATSVEAVWAKLAQGKNLSIVGKDHTIYLQPAAAGTLTRFQRRLDGVGLEHLILVDKRLIAPTYAEKSAGFLFYLNEAQAIAQTAQHISQLVKIAVFPDWHTYLWMQGQAQKLVNPLAECVYHLDLDLDKWTRLISQGLAEQHLHFPI